MIDGRIIQTYFNIKRIEITRCYTKKNHWNMLLSYVNYYIGLELSSELCIVDLGPYNFFLVTKLLNSKENYNI